MNTDDDRTMLILTLPILLFLLGPGILASFLPDPVFWTRAHTA